MMRSNFRVGWILLLAIAGLPLLPAAAEDGSGPLIRLAQPGPVQPAAPAQPIAQRGNENEQTPSAPPSNTPPANTAPEQDSGEAIPARQQATREGPRGILAPLFNRRARSTPRVAQGPSTRFSPRSNPNNIVSQPLPANSTPPEPEPTSDAPATANSTAPAVLPSLPIEEGAPGMLRLAERPVAPPAIAPAPPANMVVMPAPQENLNTPEVEPNRTSPQPEVQTAETASPTVQTPEQRVVVTPPPAMPQPAPGMRLALPTGSGSGQPS